MAGVDGRERVDGGPAWRGEIEQRLAVVEGHLGRLGLEVRTTRLVVEDGEGRERIVGEVVGGTAELRVELGDEFPAERSGVALAASPLVTGRDATDDGMGPAVAVQVWADGDPVIGIEAWPDEGGRWRPHLHVDGGL
jgi:hypothetical protein